MPEDKGLLSDKKTAYEQSAFEKRQKEKMNTLQDLAVSLEQEEPAAVSYTHLDVYKRQPHWSG